MRLPRSAWLYLGSVVLAALVLLAVWMQAGRAATLATPGLLVLLTVLAVVAQQFSLVLTPRYQVNVAPAIYFAALLLLGASAAMALTGVSQVLGGALLAVRWNPQTARRRRGLPGVLFNAAQLMLAIGIGGLVYEALLPHRAPAPLDRLANLWAVPAAAVTFYLVTSWLVAIMVGLHRRERPGVVWWASWRDDALESAGLALLGLITALLATHYPWAPLLLIVPALLFHLATDRTVQFLEARKAAEGALAAEREFLHALLESLQEGIVACDAAGALTLVNRAARSLPGLAPPPAEGAASIDLYQSDGATRLALTETPLARALAGEVVRDVEVMLAPPGASWRVLRANGQAIEDEQGHKLGAVVAMHDITERALATAALRENEARFRALVQNTSDLIAVLARDGTVRYVSPAIRRLLGYDPAAVVGTNAFALIHPDDRARVQAVFDALSEAAAVPHAVEFRLQHHAGLWRAFEAIGTNLLGDPGVGGIVINSRDITERRQAEAALRDSEARYRAVVEQAAEGIFLVDAETQRIGESNAACQRLLGYTAAELRGLALVSIIAHPPASIVANVQRSLDVPQLTIGERRYRRKDGAFIDVEVSATRLALRGRSLLCVVLRDIGERKTFEAQLRHQAFHDTLTGLPNRALLLDRLDHALTRAVRRHETLAVLFVDLDRFKIINDSLGHAAGDQLLVQVARRLQQCVRGEDTLARFGGDEFTLLREELADSGEAVRVAERLAAALSAPFTIAGQEVFVTASIGVALNALHHTGADDLLRDADSAMYRAKSGGRARYELFDPSMSAAAHARLALETDLRRAIGPGACKEFVLHYQPIVDLASGQIAAIEALVRWQHPTRGLVSPAAFIPLVEETGLILPLGRWVLQCACQQARAWQLATAGSQPCTVNVNLSARQFLQGDIVADVAAALVATGLPASCLTLEITESVLMAEAELNQTKLQALTALGVRLAIDDFGTGYSSLAYLKRLPVETLKIDQTFVAGLGSNAKDTAIVAAVVTLARALGLTVVAEGVTTVAQSDQLWTLGCTLGQGAHFAMPLPAENLTTCLAAAHCAVPSPQAATQARAARQR
ncbi:MAG: sensor domain-containing protein [Thermomicrobiales bacterium]